MSEDDDDGFVPRRLDVTDKAIADVGMGPIQFDAEDTTVPTHDRPRCVMVALDHVLAATRQLPLVDAVASPGREGHCGDGAWRSPAIVMRFPHPQHGEPALFLYNAAARGAAREGPRASPPSPPPEAVLFELQWQEAPSGYAQTWFIDNAVEPDRLLAIATPFDITFLALLTVSTHPMRDKFLSFSDLLFYGGSHSDLRNPEASVAVIDWQRALSDVRNSVHESTGVRAQVMIPHSRGSGGEAETEMATDFTKPLLDALARCLPSICDVREITGDGSTDGVPSVLQYYRFSEEKLVEWVNRKVDRLVASHSLQDLLMTTNVSRSMALSVVLEYLPRSLHALVIHRCGGGEAQVTEGFSVVTSYGGTRGDVHGGAGGRYSLAAEARKVRPALKSASVRRLEKAGRPKGTPTLMAMFAAKPKPNGGEGGSAAPGQ